MSRRVSGPIGPVTAAVVALYLSAAIPLTAQTSSYDADVTAARDALRTGDANKAYSNCDAARKLEPGRFEAYIVCASALDRLQKTEDAIGMLQMALVNAPEDRKADIRSAIDKMRATRTVRQSPAREPANAPAAPTAQEIVLWKSIESSGSEADLNTYLRAYPNGAYVPLAQQKLNSIMEAKAVEKAKLDAQKAKADAEKAKLDTTAAEARLRLPGIQQQVASLFSSIGTIELPDSFRRSGKDWMTHSVSYSITSEPGCILDLVETDEQHSTGKLAKDNLDQTTSNIHFNLLNQASNFFVTPIENGVTFVRSPAGSVSITSLYRHWQFDTKRYEETTNTDHTTGVSLTFTSDRKEAADRIAQGLTNLSQTCAAIGAATRPEDRTKKGKKKN